MDRLLQAVGASAADRDLLALSLVCHHDAVVTAALRTLHPEGRPWVSLGLASALADQNLLAGLSCREDLAAALAESALVRSGILLVDGAGPTPERTLRPGPLLWEGLTGQPGWPAGFEVDPLPAPDWGLGHWLDTDLVAGARHAVAAPSTSAFVLVGERPEVAAARLSVLVTSAGRVPVVLRTDQLSSSSLQDVLILSVLRDVVPVLCEFGATHEHRELVVPSLAVPLLIARRHGGLTLWPRPAVFLPPAVLSAPERVQAVRAALPDLPPGPAIGSMTLEPRDLELAAAGLRARVATAGPLTQGGAHDLLLEELDRRTADTVPGGATLHHPRVGWDDVVLSPERTELLAEAVERCRLQQDLGAARLGDGRAARPRCPRPAAAVHRAARHRQDAGAPRSSRPHSGRDLLVVDLSRLVSKWIGETEKNLAAMFDAGRAGRRGAVLRRGGRPVRQAHRGRRRPRPLRQPGDGLPALPAGALRRRGRAGHQPAPQHRHRVLPPDRVRGPVRPARRAAPGCSCGGCTSRTGRTSPRTWTSASPPSCTTCPAR